MTDTALREGAGKAPEREGEGLQRMRVGPLGVVDDDQDRATGVELPHHPQQLGADDEGVATLVDTAGRRPGAGEQLAHHPT